MALLPAPRDVCFRTEETMFSAEYFRTTFAEGARPQDGAARAEVHLVSGIVFEIEGVEEVEKGHVTLRVFPPEASESAAARKRTRSESAAKGATALDRLVVAYESIACVHFAPSERQSDRSVGF
jgi:hypothetical protein